MDSDDRIQHCEGFLQQLDIVMLVLFKTLSGLTEIHDYLRFIGEIHLNILQERLSCA